MRERDRATGRDTEAARETVGYHTRISGRARDTEAAKETVAPAILRVESVSGVEVGDYHAQCGRPETVRNVVNKEQESEEHS